MRGMAAFICVAAACCWYRYLLSSAELQSNCDSGRSLVEAQSTARGAQAVDLTLTPSSSHRNNPTLLIIRRSFSMQAQNIKMVRSPRCCLASCRPDLRVVRSTGDPVHAVQLPSEAEQDVEVEGADQQKINQFSSLK